MNDFQRGILARMFIVIGLGVAVSAFTQNSAPGLWVMWGLWLPVIVKAQLALRYKRRLFHKAMDDGDLFTARKWANSYDEYPTWRSIIDMRRELKEI